MKTPISIFSVLLLALFIVPAQADQNDERLEPLFLQLRELDDVYAANAIANQIWDIWLQHEDPQASGLMNRGIAQMNSNDLYSARDTFTRLISLKPEFAEAWNKRATIYWQLGQFDASLKDIEEVLKLEPFHFGALSGRGLVYMDRGDYFLARGAFLTLLEVYPASPGVKQTIQQLESVLRDNVI